MGLVRRGVGRCPGAARARKSCFWTFLRLVFLPLVSPKRIFNTLSYHPRTPAAHCNLRLTGGRVRGRSRALAAALTAPHLCLAAAALWRRRQGSTAARQVVGAGRA